MGAGSVFAGRERAGGADGTSGAAGVGPRVVGADGDTGSLGRGFKMGEVVPSGGSGRTSVDVGRPGGAGSLTLLASGGFSGVSKPVGVGRARLSRGGAGLSGPLGRDAGTAAGGGGGKAIGSVDRPGNSVFPTGVGRGVSPVVGATGAAPAAGGLASVFGNGGTGAAVAPGNAGRPVSPAVPLGALGGGNETAVAGNPGGAGGASPGPCEGDAAGDDGNDASGGIVFFGPDDGGSNGKVGDFDPAEGTASSGCGIGPFGPGSVGTVGSAVGAVFFCPLSSSKVTGVNVGKGRGVVPLSAGSIFIGGAGTSREESFSFGGSAVVKRSFSGTAAAASSCSGWEEAVGAGS
jgi:hypothetical protein